MPGRSGATPSARAKSLVAIIDYLNPETAAHLRYQKKDGLTYCNVYAYDFCRCAGVYLPRVWWDKDALIDISNGRTPTPLYDETVVELSANGLHDWLRDYGPGFGWRREFDLTIVQDAANEGKVCVTVARRKNRNASGHIAAVVPEHRGIAAARIGGVVERAVESQAGEYNHRARVPATRWWAAAKFDSFAFWVHD